MIEPRPDQPRAYCWICRGNDCAVPRQVIGDVATWMAHRADPPTGTGEDRWPWLHGPPAAWWYGTRRDTAA